MTKRKKIPQKILMRVLVACARRCCLCFGLDSDFSEKKGQVAHIDRNPANHSEHNLVYLCLVHHDTFDSSTSQSKGITKEEVLFYRNKLLETVKTRLPAQASDEHGTQEAIAAFLESVRHDQPFNSGMLNGYEIQRACNDNSLIIDPFIENQLTSSGYRLSCGVDGFIGGHSVTFSHERPLKLQPDGWAVLSTLEAISMPMWLTGRLAPHQAINLRIGFFTTAPSIIDPGYQGCLFITAHNRSKNSLVISPGLSLVTLQFFLLNIPPDAWSPTGHCADGP